MKETTSIVWMIMSVGLIFLIFGFMLIDLDTAFPAENYTTSFGDNYSYADDIEEEVEPIKEQMQLIQDEEKGWKQFVIGLSAIPNFIVGFLSIMLTIFTFPVTLVVGFATSLQIPKAVIAVISTMVSVFLILLLVQWWQGGRK